MAISIEALASREHAQLVEHFARHFAESGRDGDVYFMPYEPDAQDRPRGVDAAALDVDLETPGWQRCWVARDEDSRIVGHVDLKGGHLPTMLHRCELGIGLERPWRAQGLGRRLMQVAIDFCQSTDSIRWLDLRVFAHNTGARRLYEDLGFMQIGYVRDLCRIEGHSVDDVLMTLPVSTDSV